MDRGQRTENNGQRAEAKENEGQMPKNKGQMSLMPDNKVLISNVKLLGRRFVLVIFFGFIPWLIKC